MPSVDLAAFRTVVGKPLIVIVGHVPILVIIMLTVPVWLLMPFFPFTQRTARFLVRELRSWSAEIIKMATLMQGGRDAAR